MTRQIHVHIDRLVLDGVPAEGLDRAQLTTEVSSALEELLGCGGLGGPLAAGGSWPVVHGGDLDCAGRPGGLGARIAHAVHDGLRGRAGAGP